MNLFSLHSSHFTFRNMKVKTLMYICLITFAYIICGVQSILSPSYYVTASEAPFMAYLQSGNYYCGGVILSEHVILTAGHCIVPHMTVRAGGSFDSATQIVDVQKTLQHENFLLDRNGIQTYNDIGLLLLDTPLKLNPNVQPIEWSNTTDFEKSVTIYGWGSTDAFENIPSDYLVGKNISLIAENLCIEMLNKAITKCDKQAYELCAEKGACRGDSGGPLLQTDATNVTKLIGIISWGADDNLGCDTAPAIFVNVGYFSEWISDGIRSLMKDKVLQNVDDKEKVIE